jgi:hypothetical protein
MRSAGNLIAKLQKITHSDLNNQTKVLDQNFHKSFQLPQITIPKLPARFLNKESETRRKKLKKQAKIHQFPTLVELTLRAEVEKQVYGPSSQAIDREFARGTYSL